MAVLDWVAGALLVLVGFGAALGLLLWWEARRGGAHRRRILDYVRMETERNRRVADGLIALLSPGTSAQGFHTLTGLSEEAWRAAVAEWRLTRLSPAAATALTDAAQCARLVNSAIASYQTYGMTQSAMANYRTVLERLAAEIVAGAKMYLAAIDRLTLPAT